MVKWIHRRSSLRRIVADAPGPAYFAAFWSASEQQY
jgi:hypothetical protein